jgi:hypothetical protein
VVGLEGKVVLPRRRTTASFLFAERDFAHGVMRMASSQATDARAFRPEDIVLDILQEKMKKRNKVLNTRNSEYIVT